MRGCRGRWRVLWQQDDDEVEELLTQPLRTLCGENAQLEERGKQLGVVLMRKNLGDLAPGRAGQLLTAFGVWTAAIVFMFATVPATFTYPYGLWVVLAALLMLVTALVGVAWHSDEATRGAAAKTILELERTKGCIKECTYREPLAPTDDGEL